MTGLSRTVTGALLVWTVASGCSGPPASVESRSAAHTAATVWRLTPEIEVRTLAPGVWMHTSWGTLDDGSRFPSNGLVVREGGAVTLVDTGWGVEPTERILGWIDEELGLPLERALVTHFHEDRLSGTPALARKGVPVQSLAMTIELAGAGGAPPLTPIEGLGLGSVVAVGPVDVFYPGPGHTLDNIVVWVRDSAVLFGGCAVRPGDATGMGNTADADMDAWPESIRAVQRQFPNPGIVVPSHGEPGGAELLDHTVTLLERGPV